MTAPLDNNFVTERRAKRKALFLPKRPRVKSLTLSELAQVWQIDKKQLKLFLLAQPEFASLKPVDKTA